MRKGEFRHKHTMRVLERLAEAYRSGRTSLRWTDIREGLRLGDEQIRRALNELKGMRYVAQLYDRSYMITLKGMEFLLRKASPERCILEMVHSPKHKKASECIKSLYRRVRESVMSREPGDFRISLDLYASMDLINFLCDYRIMPDDFPLLERYAEFLLDAAKIAPRVLENFLSVPQKPEEYFDMVGELSEVYEKRRTYGKMSPHPLTIFAKVASSLRSLMGFSKEVGKHARDAKVRLNVNWKMVSEAEKTLCGLLSRPEMVRLCPLVPYLPLRMRTSLIEAVYYSSLQEFEVEDLNCLVDVTNSFFRTALLIRLFAELERFRSMLWITETESHRKRLLRLYRHFKDGIPIKSFELYREKHKLYRIYRLACRLVVLCFNWRVLGRSVSPSYFENVIQRTLVESFRDFVEAMKKVLSTSKGGLNGLSVVLTALQYGKEMHFFPDDLRTELDGLEQRIREIMWGLYRDSIKMNCGEILNGWMDEWSHPVTTSVRVLRAMIRAGEILPVPP